MVQLHPRFKNIIVLITVLLNIQLLSYPKELTGGPGSPRAPLGPDLPGTP